MKTYIKYIIVAMFICTIAQARPHTSNYSYNAWENYYSQYGGYFDNFFNQSRVLYYPPDRSAHERTIALMARQGIPYTNQYTGQYNGAQTAQHIFNTSRTVEEYKLRMELWKRYGK